MRILQVQNERAIRSIIWLLNKLSLIEYRYQSGEGNTSSIADYYKHPTKEIWFIDYGSALEQIGDEGRDICRLLERVVKEETVQFLDIDENSGYFDPQPIQFDRK